MNNLNQSKAKLISELQELRQENNILKAIHDKDITGYGLLKQDLIIASEANWERNEYLEQLLNCANSPIIIWDTQFRITRFNKSFESLTGISEKDVIGKCVDILFPPSLRDSSMNLIKNTIEGTPLEISEISIQNIDGSIHTILWNSANILMPNKKTPYATIAQGYDITMSRQAEIKLKEKKEQIEKQIEEKEKREAELIIANIELAFQNEEKEKRAEELIIANKELLFQNQEKEKRAAELIIANKELAFQVKEKEKRADELIIANIELDYQSEEKEKRADELVIANKELDYQSEEKVKRADELVIANKELDYQSEEKMKRADELIIANKELIFQNKEKEKRADELILANKELLYQNEEKEKRAAELIVANKELIHQNQEKEIRAAELIIANNELVFQFKEKEKRAAELVIAKERAEESDHLKTAFLHNISHEIRTPMNAIVGFSGFLNDPKLLPEKRQHFIDIIVQSSNQLLSIISDIVSIATIESGQERIIEKEIDINAALLLLHEQFLIKANNQNIHLNLKPFLPAHEIWIKTDETKLIQVLTNLISNALKFTKNGYVNFGLEVNDIELSFFIEDTGIGIPVEMQDEIFKRFRQVETSSARQFGGSGLGLSISKAYVELLGGKMWLKSELGKGSTFYFTIPHIKAQKNVLSETQPDIKFKSETKKLKTILIAEDEDSNFILLEELLSRSNFNIIRAINGLEAIDICNTNKCIDLVLMDIKMPIIDGYEATKQIKVFMPNLPIIAQTAYFTDIDKSKALACGCTDFISKPIKQELLFSKIEAQLANAVSF